MELKLKTPDFKKEWRDALRFREFEKMGYDGWLDNAKNNSEVVDYSSIKDKLSNTNLDFNTLQDKKKKNFHKNFKKGEMEMPIAVKFNDNDIKLIGGNTRLAGLNSKNANPKIWLVNLNNDKKNELSEKEEIKGGFADEMNVNDIAKRHNLPVKKIQSQLDMGIKVEYEHTDDKDKSREIALDHLYEIPDYYTRLDKMEKEALKEWGYNDEEKGEQKEVTSAGSSGSFEAPMGGKTIKKPISKIHNSEMDIDEVTSSSTSAAGQYDASAFVKTGGDPLKIGGEKTIKKSKAVKDPNFPKLGGPKGKFVNEITDSSISAGSQYDVPYGGGPRGRKDPLKIGGPESIKKSKAVKDKNFPKFGGPEGIYIKIKEKCKKFPYCNQGDINAIEVLKESIKSVSEKHGIPIEKVEKSVLNEIKRIFINEYENQRNR